MHSLDVAGANQGPLSLNPARWRELMQEEGGAGEWGWGVGGYRPQGPLALLSQIIFNKSNHVLFIVPCAGALLPSKHARAFFLLSSGRCSGHMLASEAGEPPFSAEVERRRLEADAGMEPAACGWAFHHLQEF